MTWEVCQLDNLHTFPPFTPLIAYYNNNNAIKTLMRKIESQMNQAILNRTNWQSSNTSVQIDPETNNASVYLHGNKIAEVSRIDFRLFDGGWQSNTTKSRLNAIIEAVGKWGEGVYQKDWTWYFRLSDKTSIPFVSGMLLD